jgi:hypothetical protein
MGTEVEINMIWETIREIINISTKNIMNCRSISHGLMKDAQNSYIRGNKLNCSGYRMQMK